MKQDTVRSLSWAEYEFLHLHHAIEKLEKRLRKASAGLPAAVVAARSLKGIRRLLRQTLDRLDAGLHDAVHPAA